MSSQPNLLHEYEKLLRQFGPQGWWPVYRLEGRAVRREVTHNPISRLRPQTPDLMRCPCPKRLTESDRFQICVGAILTQNTAWTNVEKVFERFQQFSPPLAGRGSDLSFRSSRRAKEERGRVLWTPRTIASLRHHHLAQLIRPAGYFNQKARKLRIFSRWLLDRYDGSLAQFFRQPTDVCRAELLSLWGIGPETADSMLLYAGRHPVFVIDAYTKRWLVAQKLSNTKCWTYDECRRFFMDRLPHNTQLFNEFHALLVVWGKEHGPSPSF
ncbi:hypothetical protein HY635_02920 [Candidatus Uhrbacteria bacterium]|nr:hypothetical protein [Candidatus Uhrbacteria bacterium]